MVFMGLSGGINVKVDPQITMILRIITPIKAPVGGTSYSGGSLSERGPTTGSHSQLKDPAAPFDSRAFIDRKMTAPLRICHRKWVPVGTTSHRVRSRMRKRRAAEK